MTASNSNVGAPASGAMPRVHHPSNGENTMKKHSVHARLVAALILALPLAACGEQGQAEELVRANLKDPESARFGEFYYNEAKGKACLEVNAKNSMGGYVGDRQAQLKHSAEGWEFVEFMDESSSRDDCHRYWADEA